MISGSSLSCLPQEDNSSKAQSGKTYNARLIIFIDSTSFRYIPLFITSAKAALFLTTLINRKKSNRTLYLLQHPARSPMTLPTKS
jgi:hypothetical protein